MDGVPAAQDLRRLKGVKEVLVADRAIALHRVLYTDVVVAQLGRVACAARFAMEKVVAAAHAADAALLAVELLLAQIVIEQIAHGAKVGAEPLACSRGNKGAYRLKGERA